jgi:hypothetical protein
VLEDEPEEPDPQAQPLQLVELDDAELPADEARRLDG